MRKPIVRNQYQGKFSQVIDLKETKTPKEGWIRVARKALGMSSPQLAKRMGISKSQASQMERMEAEDRITLKQLRRAADALDCDLVYAIVPRKHIAELIRDRAIEKARQLVNKADVQMKFEAQQLSDEKLEELVEIEVDRLIREMPRDLWED